MDKQTVTPAGGLNAKSAAEMKLQANLLPSFSLVEKAEPMQTDAMPGAKGDPQTDANMRNWMECVRSRRRERQHPVAGYSHFDLRCA